MKRKTKPAMVLKFLLWSMMNCFLFCTRANAQTRTVTGTVTSASAANEAVPGATVTVRGTNRMTTTNAQGQFTIQASPNEVLVVSSVGYVARDGKVGNSTNHLTHYTHAENNKSSLSNNNVICELQDSRGWIWAGTRDDLILYSEKNFEKDYFRTALLVKQSVTY